MQNIQAIHTFIQNNPLAVLCTITPEGKPWASVVYVGSDSQLTLYFMTKSATAKHRNLALNQSVAIAFADEENQTTLQVQGEVKPVSGNQEGDAAEEALTTLKRRGDDWIPPLLKLPRSETILYTIQVHYARLSDFGGRLMGEGAHVIEYKAS